MKTPELNVRDVARLARLALSDDEVATFQAQLAKVIEHVERLKSLDVDGVEPTAHASAVFNVVRADEPRPGLDRDDVLAIVPRQANTLVIVPKVIE
jgi:aspartyl-tRNA(Asn)/glutamyl-tRNA(Gln) amidotransferase subunit C